MLDKKNDEDKKFIESLKKQCMAAIETKWSNEKARPRLPIIGHDMSPIKDGDQACDKQGIPLAEKHPEYAGHWIIRAGATKAPVVVDRARKAIESANEIYGGCWCRVNLNAYAYEFNGNKGVSFGLNGVQKIDDDEGFGSAGPRRVEDMFEEETSKVYTFSDDLMDDVPF